MGYLDDPGFAAAVHAVLADSLALPDDFKNFVVQWQALNGLPVPISQITGFNLSSLTIPSGTMFATAVAAAPAGFLPCDGAPVDRTAYSSLFSAIGIAYGAGNGTTTFNVPDCQGRIPVGLGSNGDVNALGASDGLSVGSRSPKHNTTPGTLDLNNDGSTSGDGRLVTTDHGPIGAGIALGPGGSRPTDTPAFVVVNYIIKT